MQLSVYNESDGVINLQANLTHDDSQASPTAVVWTGQHHWASETHSLKNQYGLQQIPQASSPPAASVAWAVEDLLLAGGPSVAGDPLDLVGGLSDQTRVCSWFASSE